MNNNPMNNNNQQQQQHQQQQQQRGGWGQNNNRGGNQMMGRNGPMGGSVRMRPQQVRIDIMFVLFEIVLMKFMYFRTIVKMV